MFKKDKADAHSTAQGRSRATDAGSSGVTQGRAGTSDAGSATPQGSTGKGRPTPKRKDAQARSLHPVVPRDRKAAKREARAKRDEAWARQRQAMVTGDDRYLPLRDKGPIKRYIRDYIDARFSLGELFLPSTIVLLVIVIGFSALSTSVQATMISFYLMLVIYALFLLAIIDAIMCWYLLRKRLYASFGQQRVKEQGIIFWYIFSRCFNVRRWRQPVPQVRRREYPS